MDKSKNPLRVALHGMDTRSCNMMAMYLQGPCKGVASIVANDAAEIDIFDADSMAGRKLLQESRAAPRPRPVIALSLNPGLYQDFIAVQKPVKSNEMMAALDKAYALLAGRRPPDPKAQAQPAAAPPPSGLEQAPGLAVGQQAAAPAPAAPEPPPLKKYVIDTDERKKTAKHQAAQQLSEKGFGAFIGNVPGLDVNDPKQFAKANYTPKEYYQGYVDAAFKTSRTKNEASQLNSGWLPLLIFPEAQEVWLDADDNQLRSFSGLAINKTLGTKITVTPLPKKLAEQERALDKYQSMDAFLWKIACWASKGRYPAAIDISQPVYLKHWPNFTRLLVTPHAMRITALLMRGPRTLPDIAQALNIKPQYVFVFISAAYALGLAGQAKRGADVLVAPAEVKPAKHQSLLGRILSVLRGKNVS